MDSPSGLRAAFPIVRTLLDTSLCSLFSESTSESMMQPRMSRENIVSFMMLRDTLSEFQRGSPSGYSITMRVHRDNVLSMTPREIDELQNTRKRSINY